MITRKLLLVSGHPYVELVVGFIEDGEVILKQLFLCHIIEGENPWGAMLDLYRHDNFSSINEEERGLTSWLGCGGMDGPHNTRKRVDPPLATVFDLAVDTP